MSAPKLHKNTHARMLVRIQAVQALRASKNAARREAATREAFIAGVQQLAAQLGVDAQSLLNTKAYNARANSATVAPSRELIVINGEALRPCAAVHVLCEQHPDMSRAEMIQLCVDNGINKATASTQVGVFRTKAAKAAAQQ